MIGTWDKETRSISTGRGQRNVSTQITRERILENSDLSALPRQRGVFIGAGVRPVLVKTIPWFEQPNLAKQLHAATANDTSDNEVAMTTATAQR